MCLQWSSVAFKIYLANKSSDKHGGAKMRSRTHAARQKFEVCERFFFFLHILPYAYECCMAKAICVRY